MRRITIDEGGGWKRILRKHKSNPKPNPYTPYKDYYTTVFKHSIPKHQHYKASHHSSHFTHPKPNIHSCSNNLINKTHSNHPSHSFHPLYSKQNINSMRQSSFVSNNNNNKHPRRQNNPQGSRYTRPYHSHSHDNYNHHSHNQHNFTVHYSQNSNIPSHDPHTNSQTSLYHSQNHTSSNSHPEYGNEGLFNSHFPPLSSTPPLFISAQRIFPKKPSTHYNPPNITASKKRPLSPNFTADPSSPLTVSFPMPRDPTDPAWNGLCYTCIEPGHHSSNCQNQKKCTNCGSSSHIAKSCTIIHPSQPATYDPFKPRGKLGKDGLPDNRPASIACFIRSTTKQASCFNSLKQALIIDARLVLNHDLNKIRNILNEIRTWNSNQQYELAYLGDNRYLLTLPSSINRSKFLLNCTSRFTLAHYALFPWEISIDAAPVTFNYKVVLELQNLPVQAWCDEELDTITSSFGVILHHGPLKNLSYMNRLSIQLATTSLSLLPDTIEVITKGASQFVYVKYISSIEEQTIYNYPTDPSPSEEEWEKNLQKILGKHIVFDPNELLLNSKASQLVPQPASLESIKKTKPQVQVYSVASKKPTATENPIRTISHHSVTYNPLKKHKSLASTTLKFAKFDSNLSTKLFTLHTGSTSQAQEKSQPSVQSPSQNPAITQHTIGVAPISFSQPAPTHILQSDVQFENQEESNNQQ